MAEKLENANGVKHKERTRKFSPVGSSIISAGMFISGALMWPKTATGVGTLEVASVSMFFLGIVFCIYSIYSAKNSD